MTRCAECGFENAPGLKFCGECGTKLSDAARQSEVRKTVTVLFSDIAGSTSLGERLDPESVRALLARYFGEIKTIIERHGGTVEKFIGDAVMAVFGIPTTHENDALRAVRAAAEIKNRLAELDVEMSTTRGIRIAFRTGVYTGEVVAGDAATAQTLVTGDTVNTAARLEQAAPPGEILLGMPTYRLIRDAVEVEAFEPIAAKGKSEPVAAYRLISLAKAERHARPADTPFVGRQSEVSALEAGYRRAVSESRPLLATVLGGAGVGKSRLLAEFARSVTGEATVVKGRCLPYGDGITYWPLREIVHAAAAITEADTTDDARAKLRRLLDGDPAGDLLARRVGGAVGLETDAAPQEDIFWATRKFLEHMARRKPLVTVWEDIHWAEPTLLDLLEYVLDLAADAPLLLVCATRPELMETRPGWGGRPNSQVVRLEPLSAERLDELVDGLPGGQALPVELRRRIIDAADGNPLYVEEMLRMLVDDDRLVERDGVWIAQGSLERLAVPPSVKALLAARIDALPSDERTLAQRASVAGRSFEAAAVRVLVDAPGDVGRTLLSLVRKELVRPERSELSAGDAFKFRHLLIRDAAYEALAKSVRAELHEVFADWLERAAGDRVNEYDEILAHHVEQAYLYRVELGETGDRVKRLRQRATELYVKTGMRARARGDVNATIRLLTKAEETIGLDDPVALDVRTTLAEANSAAGAYDVAQGLTSELIASAEVRGDERAVLRGRVLRVSFTLRDRSLRQAALMELDELKSRVEAVNDPVTSHRYWAVAGMEQLTVGLAHAAAVAFDKAASAAAMAGDDRAVQFHSELMWFAAYLGSIPYRQALSLVEQSASRLGPEPPTGSLTVRGLFLAELADIERAGALWAEAEAALRDRGARQYLALHDYLVADVRLRRQEFTAAEQAIRASIAFNEEAGDEAALASLLPMLAIALLAQATPSAEASASIERAAGLGHAADVDAQTRLRLARAEAAHLVHDDAAAIQMVREALDILEPTDWLAMKADVWRARGRYLAAAGHSVEAERALEAARDLYDQKGAVAASATAMELLDKLRATTAA